MYLENSYKKFVENKINLLVNKDAFINDFIEQSGYDGTPISEEEILFLKAVQTKFIITVKYKEMPDVRL